MTDPAKQDVHSEKKPESRGDVSETVRRGINGTDNESELQRRGAKDQDQGTKEETGATETGDEDKGAKR